MRPTWTKTYTGPGYPADPHRSFRTVADVRLDTEYRCVMAPAPLFDLKAMPWPQPLIDAFIEAYGPELMRLATEGKLLLLENFQSDPQTWLKKGDLVVMTDYAIEARRQGVHNRRFGIVTSDQSGDFVNVHRIGDRPRSKSRRYSIVFWRKATDAEGHNSMEQR